MSDKKRSTTALVLMLIGIITIGVGIYAAVSGKELGTCMAAFVFGFSLLLAGLKLPGSIS